MRLNKLLPVNNNGQASAYDSQVKWAMNGILFLFLQTGAVKFQNARGLG